MVANIWWILVGQRPIKSLSVGFKLKKYSTYILKFTENIINIDREMKKKTKLPDIRTIGIICSTKFEGFLKYHKKMWNPNILYNYLEVLAIYNNYGQTYQYLFDIVIRHNYCYHFVFLKTNKKLTFWIYRVNEKLISTYTTG